MGPVLSDFYYDSIDTAPLSACVPFLSGITICACVFSPVLFVYSGAQSHTEQYRLRFGLIIPAYTCAGPSQRFWGTKPSAAWLCEDYCNTTATTTIVRAAKDSGNNFIDGLVSSPPIEFLQEPGDVVYVPADWGHAVLNLEDSVAVAFEVKWP